MECLKIRISCRAMFTVFVIAKYVKQTNQATDEKYILVHVFKMFSIY